MVNLLAGAVGAPESRRRCLLGRGSGADVGDRVLNPEASGRGSGRAAVADAGCWTLVTGSRSRRPRTRPPSPRSRWAQSARITLTGSPTLRMDTGPAGALVRHGILRVLGLRSRGPGPSGRSCRSCRAWLPPRAGATSTSRQRVGRRARGHGRSCHDAVVDVLRMDQQVRDHRRHRAARSEQRRPVRLGLREHRVGSVWTGMNRTPTRARSPSRSQVPPGLLGAHRWYGDDEVEPPNASQASRWT
jgi:hypothetical protein